jgi:TolA-binding protein
LRTSTLSSIFAVSLSIASAAQTVTNQEHLKARRLMAQVEQSANPVQLLVLAMDIREALGKALAANPDDVDVRIDLVRFHTSTPRIAGGDPAEARAQAAEIAKRDPAAGHFASGYIAYRDKNYGSARQELKLAVDGAANPTRKALAMRWLGWLSQETQQWQTAFAMFEALGDDYEIGRTAAFCRCELARGRAALEKYIATKPKNVVKAKEYLKKLRR